MAFSYNKKNLANTTISGSLSASATSVTVNDASVFPVGYFYATLMPSSEVSEFGNSEIVLVTNITGNVLTIARAQNGTTARAFNDGSIITNGIYTQDMDMAQAVGKKIFDANWDSEAGYYKINDPMLKIVPDEGTSIRVVFDTDVPSGTSAALSVNENTDIGTATKIGKNIEIRDANALPPVSVGLNGDTEQDASPSPDYPQTVQTVTGEQTITISDGGSNSKELKVNLGKNLVDASQISQAATNVGITVDSDGLIKTSQPSDDYRSWDFADRNWEVTLPAGVYTFSVTFKKQCTMNIGGLFAIAKGASDGLFNALSSSYMNKDSLARTIHIDKTTTIGIEMKCGDGEAYLQVEKGGTATAFAKYFTPIELCKIGTYQDYIYKSGDDWYIHKEITKKVLDGTETGWTAASHLYILPKTSWAEASLPIYSTNIVSDYFNATNNYDIANATIGKIYLGDNYLNFNYDNDGTNLAGFKTWLGSNNVSVYALLATSTDTQITNSTLIDQLEALASTALYEGQNDITVSGDLAGYLNLTYNTINSGVYVANIVNGAYILDNNTRNPAPAKAGLPYDLTYHSGNWYIMNMIGEVVLPDSVVTTNKIADGAVTSSKMDWSTMLHFTAYVSEVTNVTVNAGGGILKYFSEFFGGTTAWSQMMSGKKIVSANVYVSGSGSTGDIRTKLMVASSEFDNWNAYGFGINNVGAANRTVGCKVFLLLADV